MRGAASVVIDRHRGEAALGSFTVPIRSAGPAGEIRVGGADGPVLRPPAFRERTRAVASALAGASPRDAVCANLLELALVQPGPADRRVLEILALALAGAGGNAPCFAKAALWVARASGWDYEQLAGAEAAEVDRLARHLAGAGLSGGWSRLMIVPSQGDELDRLRGELADDLLRRGDESTGEPAQSGAGPRAGAAAGAEPPVSPALPSSRVDDAYRRPERSAEVAEPAPSRATPASFTSADALPAGRPVALESPPTSGATGRRLLSGAAALGRPPAGGLPSQGDASAATAPPSKREFNNPPLRLTRWGPGEESDALDRGEVDRKPEAFRLAAAVDWPEPNEGSAASPATIGGGGQGAFRQQGWLEVAATGLEAADHAGRVAAPDPLPFELAEALAELLHEEADGRGIER